LALTGLVSSIFGATLNIDAGRKGFATRGKEQEGRLSYEDGIAEALTAFQEAQVAADAQTLILAEYTFIAQEFQLADETDLNTRSSLTQAIQSFDDAFLALEVVGEPCYKAVDKACPHNVKYRVNGFPKDAFHIACIAHKTRLNNILRSPGIDQIEKSLLKQRLANMGTAQQRYIELQKKLLTI
jgi:hypothetical protein